jgi:hypothetical protein
MGLFGELVGGEVVSLFVSGRGGHVGVSGEVMQFGSGMVLAWAHGEFPRRIGCRIGA